MITEPNELADLNLFPDQTNLFFSKRDISGLTKDAQPSGDWVVEDSFKEKRLSSDREFYLVHNKVTNQYALIRICDAYPDSGYDRFCVVHEVNTTGEAVACYYRWKESLS